LRRMLYNRQGVVLKFGLAREISNSYAQRTGYSRNPQNKPPKQGKWRFRDTVLRRWSCKVV